MPNISPTAEQVATERRVNDYSDIESDAFVLAYQVYATLCIPEAKVTMDVAQDYAVRAAAAHFVNQNVASYEICHRLAETIGADAQHSYHAENPAPAPTLVDKVNQLCRYTESLDYHGVETDPDGEFVKLSDVIKFLEENAI